MTTPMPRSTSTRKLFAARHWASRDATYSNSVAAPARTRSGSSGKPGRSSRSTSPDLTPVYTEAARVLCPGGQLFLCELHPFKQLTGAQARFTDPATGETVRVQAFRHTVSEYVNTALAAGFQLRELGEWSDADAPPGTPPRLLSVLFERS